MTVFFLYKANLIFLSNSVIILNATIILTYKSLLKFILTMSSDLHPLKVIPIN